MSKNIQKRLQNLAIRRTGFQKDGQFGMDALQEAYTAGPPEEQYQKRAAKENSKYALGAMQEVEPKYTAICLSEAERVKLQLRAGFNALGIAVDFKIQGSVAANLHIRGSSDVDMLLLDDRFFTYDADGNLAKGGRYTPYLGKNPLDSLREIRTEALKILRDKYPEVKIDAGPKAICLSGGSLRREIDVVPSHWHNTIDYQNQLSEYLRGIYILDNDKNNRLFNQPFLHIQRIDERDQVANGSLKKSIRLCKNVKQDANDDGNNIQLSSFDIAACMWHSNLNIWKFSLQRELGILGETARHLMFLNANRQYAATLDVPDGSRKIFDSDGKFTFLDGLTREITDLAIEVAIEQGATRDWEKVQGILNESIVA